MKGHEELVGTFAEQDQHLVCIALLKVPLSFLLILLLLSSQTHILNGVFEC